MKEENFELENLDTEMDPELMRELEEYQEWLDNGGYNEILEEMEERGEI